MRFDILTEFHEPPLVISCHIKGVVERFAFHDFMDVRVWMFELQFLVNFFNRRNTCMNPFKLYCLYGSFLSVAHQFVNHWHNGHVPTAVKRMIELAEDVLDIPSEKKMFRNRVAPSAWEKYRYDVIWQIGSDRLKWTDQFWQTAFDWWVLMVFACTKKTSISL